jgi:hypothetical protein
MFGFGSSSGSGVRAVRSKNLHLSVATDAGPLASVSGFGLLAPAAWLKTGGHTNLTIGTRNGVISAESALPAGATQSLTGTVTGADGVVIPFIANLTGESTLPGHPPPALTLVELSGAFSLSENAAAGALAGSIVGKTAGSTLSLLDDAGGRVALASPNIVRGATALNYEAASSHNFTVRETLSDSPNSPRDTVFTLAVTNVFEAASLSALSLSSTAADQNAPTTLNIVGSTGGSTISLLSGILPTGMALSSALRQITGTPTTPGVYSFTLRETLADSPNSPRSTALSITVNEVVTGAPILYAPVTSFPAPGTWPPAALVDLPGGYYTGDVLEYRYASTYAGALAASVQQVALSGDGTETIGLSSITSPTVTFLQTRLVSGTTTGPWSPMVKHGDTTAPSITSTMTPSAAEGQPVLHTVTTNELCTLALSGADATLLRVLDGDVPATSFTIGLVDGANLSRTAEVFYNFTVTATDLAGLAVAQAITASVTGTSSGAKLVTTTGFNKHPLAVISNNRLTAECLQTGEGVPTPVRANIEAVSSKFQFGVTIDVMAGLLVFGLDDGTTDFSTYNFGPGGTNSKGLRFLIDATSLTTHWNATAGEQVSSASFVSGTVIEVEVDRTAGSVKIFRNGVQLGATITGLDPADLRFAYLGPGTTANKLTLNAGGSPFLHALSSGFTIYG